ncbi:MAG: right-handed parallel beta-helix repeat-containing protein, partial [Clostridia bacterium]|nr:right-handed parallel beta-helix repeat-containing protein [Clostridia bacterium]
KYHGETVDPELHFSSDDLNFRIGPSGAGDTTEVAILGNDNASNWQYAVTTSLKTKKTYTVQLVDDWSAGRNSSYGTAFGINTTAYYYGALYVPSGASVILDLNGCTIDRKLTTGNVFNIVGKLEIVDLSASKNGIIKGGSNGIYIYNGGTVVMKAGTVTGNAGYGVYDYNGTFNMTGGTVGGNTGASVYVERNGRINLGGTPVINNGIGSGNLVLAYESTVIGITSKFEESANVSLLRKGVGQLTSNWSKYNPNEDPWDYLATESDVFIASTEDVSGSLEASLISYDNNINWQYAVSSSLSTKTTKSMQLYEDWLAADNSSYTTAFGTTSAYINGALYVPKGASVVLDLSGFNLNRGLSEARANGYVIYVQGELRIFDSRAMEEGEGALITGGKNSSGSSAGAVYIAAGGVFTIEDAHIVSNESTSDSSGAGAVYTAGTFNFTSGVISGNAGASAGGVYIANSGAFNMADGTKIEGNTANGTAGGGAVYAAGAFGLKGGEISANGGTAGGVYVASGGNFAFEGGKITHNNGTLAGGVYVYNSASANFAMLGGEITQNSASNDKTAGGVYVAGGKFVLSDGTVSDNHADGGENTAGGVFVASAGTVTVTGGEITDNSGANGLRAEGSATVNLGGTAKIAYNSSTTGNSIDVYMTDGTRSINIVSKFEDGAEIGIWRDTAGSFTKGYGIYNGTESGVADPNEFIYSNKTTYNIFQTEVEAGESVEVAAGIPAARPYAVGAEDETLVPVYNGLEQVNVKGYDSTKMTVGDLPEGVRLTAEGFVATHAGTYALTFTLGSDYCWPNGTVAAYKVNGVIAPKPVELSWTDLEFTYDANPHKPTAEVTNLIGDDTCTVTVSKEEINADTYTATATELSNSDYTVKAGVNVTHEFVIKKAPMTLTFKQTKAVYKQELTLELNGNVEGGTVTYSVANKTGKADEIAPGSNVLKPTWVGEVEVTANVTETRNYLAGTVTETFTIEQADAPLELAVKEASYGTPLTLSVTDYGEVGTLTFAVEANKTGEAEIATGSDVFEPLAVGTVDVRVTVEATHNYKQTSVVNTVTVKPRIVTLNWTNLEFVYDGGPHCAKAEVSNLVGDDDCDLEITGTQTDAGTYNATVKSLGNANYTLPGAEDTTKQFVIHKANISPVVNTTEIEFKKTQQIDIDGNLGSGAVTLKVLEGSTGKATPSGDTLTGTWVGTIDVEVKIAETKNYKDATLTVSIDVTPADPEIDLAVKEVVYGSDLKLTVTGNEENATVHYSLTDGETKVSLTGGDTITPHDVGDVTIKIYVEPTHNYKEGNFSVTLTVKPRPVTVLWTKLAFDYDGDEHVPEATITGLMEGDEISVSVIGAQINAGTHTAMAESLGGTNSNKYTLIDGTDVTTQFTISPCPVTLSWNEPDFTYNGEMQTPTATVTNLIGTDTCTVTVLGTKDAGTNLTAMATGLSNPNYTLDGGSNLITTYAIKALPVALEWSNTTLVYTGSELKPTATVKNICGSDKCDVTVMGAQTNVGEYTATAFGVSNPNYTLIGGTNLSSPYKIVRAPISVKLVDNVLTYGTEATLAVDGNLGNGTVTYTVVNGTGTATAATDGSYILPTKVGTITVTATVAQTANYEGGSVEAVVVIQPRRVKLAWEEDMEYVYNGDEQAPQARVVDLLQGDECEVNVKGHRDVGQDLVATATSLTNENYTLLGCTTLTTTFAIVPLKAELSWSNFTLVYNGKEQAPTATVTNLKGTDTCEVTVSGETDVGTDLVASAISLSNPNYTLEGTTNLTQTFTITALVAEIVWSDTKLTYNGTEQAPTATVGNL